MALACAFLTGSCDALSKQLLTQSNERVVGWGRTVFELPWLVLVAFSAWQATLSWQFWAILAVFIPMNLAAFLCYLRAIRVSPLSLAVPFLAVTPLAAIGAGWIFLGERVSWVGFLGIAAVTVGAYVLLVEHTHVGWTGPFRAMFQEPGIRLMLLAALIYSVAATIEKKAILISNSITVFPLLFSLAETLPLSVLAYRSGGGSRGLFLQIRSQGFLYLVIGIASAGAILTHLAGVRMAPVAYFLSIKRLSILVGVLYGGLLFGEEAFLQRVVGACLMLVGAVLITLTS